jgi:hypothetical protein
MPETSMHEDNSFVFRQDNVGSAGQIRAMKSKSQASAVKEFSNGNFRSGIFSFDPPHCVAALFPTDLVGHAG